MKAVIFDMDGVLIDSEIIYYKWFKEFLYSRGYCIAEKELQKLVGLSEAQSRRKMNEMCEEIGKANIWDEYLKQSDTYSLNYNTIVNPGVRHLLQRLHMDEVKIGLASSSGINEIKKIMKQTKLEKYFDVILSGEMFQESKPNPEIYINTARELQIDIEECIIIEDSDYGIEAGKTAGAYVIAKEEKRFNFKQSKADVIAVDFVEIEKIIYEMK